jgi:cytochrome c oxidase assembly protein subunit 15
MDWSKIYLRTHWVSLVVIFLVVIAGSVVRITGSGMGCPDWPKCFGQWVPPTDETQLPDDAEEKFKEKRVEKAEKFARYLTFFGLDNTAEKLKADPLLSQEEEFNVAKTWTEYVNRLFGFLAGNIVMLLFFWTFLRYRKQRKILLMTFVNLILMGFQGWFGSIVVASNLVPWTITIHLFIALVILFIQIWLIYKISPKQSKKLLVSSKMKWLIIISWFIVFGQLFLGTQVRESIDELTRQGYARADWSEQLGVIFFIHRSFSWLVLILLGWLYWMNKQQSKHFLFTTAFIVLAIELLSGVCLAYLDLPGFVQVSHLLFACGIFAVLSFGVLRVRGSGK